eukprot:scaffold2490_cov169-Amphora_coffeaeformis.AAC.8
MSNDFGLGKVVSVEGGQDVRCLSNCHESTSKKQQAESPQILFLLGVTVIVTPEPGAHQLTSMSPPS